MAANPDDLVTLQQVKKHLGIADSDSSVDDLLQNNYITPVSKAFADYVDRKLKQATYAGATAETFSGEGTSGYSPKQYPVTAVASVTVDGETIPARPTVSDDGYVVLADRIELDGYLFTEGVANCTVEYTAGYATIPENIAQAVCVWVAEMYRSRNREGMSSRTTNQGESATFFKVDDMPFFTRFVADDYRRTNVF